MAGFGNENDIKITVALDTESAIQSAEELKNAVETSLKGFQDQFKRIENLSKQANAVLIADIQSKEKIQLQALANEAAADRRRHAEKLAQIDPEVAKTRYKYQSAAKEAQNAAQQEIAAAERAAQEKIKTDQREADNAIKLKQLEVRAAEAAAREVAALESTKRTDTLKTIAEINQATARIKKTRVGDLGGTEGSGKLLSELGNTLLTLQTRFGLVTTSTRTLMQVFSAMGPVGGAVGVAILGYTAFRTAIDKAGTAIDGIATQAGKLEGLKTGFETLQRSVGQVPTESIQRLREATQGLISDTELYQRANQAVLLGVPTKTFNEAAAAAVKLGRAMGIDAAFGLESLSLGLGRQSRLYLDNLGIIVSAEEAYRNFGIANNIVGRDLTDSEKKAAFFAEALKKIKERADELPPIFDNVGIAVKRLEVAQSNVSSRFLEGFNRSSELTRSYTEQAGVIQSTTDTYERLGEILAYFSAPIKDLQTLLIQLENSVLRDLILSLDQTFGISKVQQAEDFTNTIRFLESKLADLNKALEDGRTPPWAQSGTRAEIEQTQAEIEKARVELEKLGYILGTVQSQGGVGIKIKVDTSDIDAAKLRLAGLFDELEADVLKAGGEFEIPGLSQEALAPALAQYKELITLRKQGAIDAEAAKAKLSEILDPIKLDIQQQKLAALDQDLRGIAIAQGKLAIEGKAADAELEQSAAQLIAQREKVLKGYGLEEEATKRLGEAFKKYGKEGEKAYEDIISEQKKLDSERKASAKKQEQELKDLTKGLGRALKQAIPANIQQQLVDIFNDPKLSAEELRVKIEELGRQFLKAGGDFQAFAKEVKGLNDLKKATPERPIIGSAEQQAAADEYNKKLEESRQGILNVRDAILGAETDAATGKQKGGAFFGFDIGGEATPEAEAQAAGAFQDFLGSALQTGIDGFNREDVPGLTAQLGGALGAALGAYLGGPVGAQIGQQLGTIIGQIAGESLAELGKDLEGTVERKQIDKYFNEIFAGDRLAVIIQGQVRRAVSNGVLIIGETLEEVKPQIQRISDIVFEGFTPFAGMVRFGGEGFSTYFNTLAADVQNTFTGVGLALGTLQGVSAETARLIGTAISNNIGGSLQNLQVLVQQTGESFEDLSQAILKAFRDSQLTAEEAYNALVQLQNIYADGIPGAIGDFQQAIQNLNTSLENNQPGQYALDSLRDIGAEGEEAKATFESVISSLGQTFNFTAQQQTRLFEALRLSGITSLQQLAKASDEQLITLLKNIQAVRENAEAPLAAAPVLPSTAPSGSGRRREKSPAEIAAELLKKQREEARQLTQESQEYLKIIEKINAGQLTSVKAGKEIKQINAEILQLIKDRDATEKKLNAELDKGTKGNAKTIAELSAALQKLEERLKKVKEKAAENKREYKDLDLTAVMPLIRSQNTLGLVARQVGVNLQTNVDILVKGFLQGRKSIKEVNDEINKTKELLGPGIPNAVGAVTDAFQNLIDAGRQGGAFSTEAFTDIFAEFREKFVKEGSAFQQAQRKILNDNLDSARRALLAASGPEATEAARKALDLARKAVEDFKNTPVAPDLSDLRDQLKNSFSPEQVDLFFQALDESGLKSFEELEGASAEAIVGILGRLDELGFKFNKTSKEAEGVNRELREAEEAANGGLDPLREAINLVEAFNNGAALLPPVFNSTTEAVGKMEGPLGKIKDKISDTVKLLAQLGGQTFTNDIVFNIRTTGEQGGKALVDLIFGDGSDASSGTGNGNKTPPQKETPTKPKPKPSSSYTKKDFKYLSPGLYKNLKTGRTIKASERARLLGLD